MPNHDKTGPDGNGPKNKDKGYPDHCKQNGKCRRQGKGNGKCKGGK